jgi:hypothetical protein
MDEVTLLKRHSLDTVYSTESFPEFSKEHSRISQHGYSRIRLLIEMAILGCLVIAISLLTWLVSIQVSSSHPQLLAGSDLSGVVPAGKRQKYSRVCLMYIKHN